jgi:indole-3-glycerol phosphate synthase
MRADLLGAMIAASRRSAEERERSAGAAIERAAAEAEPRGEAFIETLQRPGLRVIAECKRRSPSRGVLAAHYAPAEIAKGYAGAGAAAISVLTDPAFFDGSLDHLRAVRAAVTLPVLRKDFLVTDFQIIESRAAGADAVLLIAAALTDPTLTALIEHAWSLGLAALVEVHDAEELNRALGAGATLVGVNSRNLRTLDVDTSLFERLSPAFPTGVTTVAESGLKSHDELVRLSALGYHAFLIGERFMTTADPGNALGGLLHAGVR